MSDVRDAGDLDGLIERLAALGETLDVDDTLLAETVLDRIGGAPAPSPRRGWLVAAAVIAIAAGIVLYPGSRDAVARWFGLDGVSVDVDPDLTLPEPPATFDAPGPGESVVVVVDGREVLVSAVDGRMEDGLIAKTVGSSDQIRQLEVMGNPGLWISGDAHQVRYVSPDDDLVVERVAADTLLWQDGAVLYRVEGFDDLADALAFVEGT